MRYFMDTEFLEDGKTIDLLSIGIVCEDGRELYLECNETDWSNANEWVQSNVLPYLKGEFEGYTRKQIAGLIINFMNPEKYGKPEIWGYYADYDWVVFCQLFGTMIDLPEGFPMFCMDLKQLSIMLGNPEHPKQDTQEHHALADARWNRDLYKFLLTRDVSVGDLLTWTLARSSEL